MNKKELKKILEKLEEIRRCQVLLDEKVISVHIDAFHVSCCEFDQVMNKVHDLICTSDELVKKAVDCIRLEVEKEVSSN
ncbi:MAG: hypothetical protein ABJF04_16075 [Reichenbachiella sp.]|uniref:hypothetical protein n=1 Tax=Reichenbachiella sp. TaxID=2184521 RepID=UPI0032669D2B